MSECVRATYLMYHCVIISKYGVECFMNATSPSPSRRHLKAPDWPLYGSRLSSQNSPVAREPAQFVQSGPVWFAPGTQPLPKKDSTASASPQ